MLLAGRAYAPAAVRGPSDPCACGDQPQHPAIPTAPARTGLRGPARAAACPRYALVTARAGSVASRARFVTAAAPPAPEEPPSAAVRALGCQCQRASPMAYQDRSRPRGQSVKPPLIGRREPETSPLERVSASRPRGERAPLPMECPSRSTKRRADRGRGRAAGPCACLSLVDLARVVCPGCLSLVVLASCSSLNLAPLDIPLRCRVYTLRGAPLP